MYRLKKYHYTGNDLGITYNKSGTEFRVWAPTAVKVNLITYPTGNDSSGQIHLMKKGEQGVWYAQLKGDFHGVYYNYLVSVGSQLHEVTDPYARACGVNGKRGMVVDLAKTNPTGWEQLKTPILKHVTDAIIYELHIRDFTISKDAGVKYPGKYLGLTEPNTKSPQNIATGLDHLKELGVTHIQLMPCFDFYTVDESKSESREYNWGYDPQNFNVPEGSYATDAYNGVIRIYEFKKMIKTLKEHGFRVIMDMVYNHTYLTNNSHINRLVPGYYYRQDPHGNFTNGSGCGNELASERFMVRKLIVDSISYWAKEYKIDGFRLDLMGLLDIITVNQIRKTLNEIDPTIILYGEGWTGGHSPLPDSDKAIKGNVGQLPGTGVFNDEFRDAIKGHVFFADQAGFVNGAPGMEESIKSGIVGAIEHRQVNYSQVIYSHFPWAAESAQSINYASSHDNLTLWDKLQKTNPKASQERLAAMQKLALAIVLTSQGIPFLHSGSEFLRTKFGNHNSYKAKDAINKIDWSLKARHYNVFSYIRGLIHLRKTHAGFRMRTADEIQTKLQFLPMPAGRMVGFMINQADEESWHQIIVIFNANTNTQEVNLPGDNWVVVVNRNQAGTSHLNTIRENYVTIPGTAACVLVDEKSYWQK
mgnify:CR=1 FL=1